MTEIVERLERQAVNVENDGHVSAARAMREAATALEEARAEIERLREQVFELEHGVEDQMEEAAYHAKQRAAAESELSTLRARVREVVGPFAEQASKYDPDEGDSHEHAWYRLDLTIGHLRAARQLMEEVK